MSNGAGNCSAFAVCQIGFAFFEKVWYNRNSENIYLVNNEGK